MQMGTHRLIWCIIGGRALERLFGRKALVERVGRLLVFGLELDTNDDKGETTFCHHYSLSFACLGVPLGTLAHDCVRVQMYTYHALPCI